MIEYHGFNIQLMTKIRAEDESIEQLEGPAQDFNTYLADGLVLSIKPKKGTRALERVRQHLQSSGYSTHLYQDAYEITKTKLR